MWVEVNQRILYAYKRACIQMQDRSILVPNNLSHAFVVSFLLQKCVSMQLGRFINAWNNHPIPGSGSPIEFVNSRKNYELPENVLPSVADAVALYQQTHSTAKFTSPHTFVEDIIPDGMKEERDRLFEEILEEKLEIIVNATANGDFSQFENCFSRLVEVQDSFFIE